MKKLIKKLLAPIAVSVAVLIPSISSAQEKPEQFNQKNYFSLGVGIYSGSGQEIQDIYGTFPRLRAGFGRDMSKNFRLEGALAYSKASGKPYTYSSGGWDYIDSKANISMLSLELLAKYVFRGKSVDFSIGGGLTSINLKEKVEIFGSIDGEFVQSSNEGSESAFGPVFVLGIDVPINKDRTTAVYGELSGRSAKIEGALGNDVEMGGTALDVGIRFNID